MTEKLFTDDQARDLIRRFEAGETMSALGREFGCNRQAIRRSMMRVGYEPGPDGWGAVSRRAESLAPEAVALYESGLSQRAVGERLGLDQTVVSRVMARHRAPVRSRGSYNRSGPAHRSWKGGRVRLNGYEAVWIDRADPLAAMANFGGYVLEHRLVMARSLGRALTKDETVHHLNGDRSDNRIENLQLRTGRHGKHAAFVCADCGSTNVVPSTLM